MRNEMGRDALPRVREDADFPVVADAQERVPPGWAMRQISELGEIVTGSTPPRSCADNWNGDFPWISAQDFGQMYIERTHEHISDIGKGYCRCLPKGSVLITCIASIGLNAVAKVECATNQQINAVICRDDVYPEWLYYAMCFREKDFRDLAGQTAVPIINKAQFAGFTLIVPPLEEQKRIAEVLADADALIANTEKRIAKRKLIKQGMMQQLLTGAVRLPGFTGEWKEKSLFELGNFVKGAGISRSESQTGDIPAVRYGELYTHHDNYVKRYVSRISKEVAKQSRLTKRGDILFTCSGETSEDIGKAVAVLDDGVYAGGDLLIFTLREECDPVFWGTLMNVPYVQIQKSNVSHGATVIHITEADLRGLIVRYPPTLAEQQAIAAVLTDMDSEIAVLEKKVEKYRRLKSGMMSELLTGKVRLSEGK